MMKLRGNLGEMKQLQDQHKCLVDQKETFAEIFSDKATQKASVIMVGIWIFFQLSGICAILFYTVEIFNVSIIFKTVIFFYNISFF